MNKPWLTLGIGPALLLAAMVLPLILYWGDLPNPMATHWDLGGDPNGSWFSCSQLLGVSICC